MEQLYNEIYRVGTLFQENRHQKIYMGESIKDPDCIVVISEFLRSDLIDSTFINTLKDNLAHLLYFEENETEAVFITAYGEGMSIFQVIDNFPNTTHFRMNLLHDYLNILKPFTTLLPIFQYILTSDSHFFIQNSELVYNELLVIDEDQFDPTVGFEQVKHRISTFAHKVLDFTPDESDAAIVVTLRGFFDDLESDLSLDSLEKIYRAYRKIYIYDMYLDKDTAAAYIPPVVPIVATANEPETVVVASAPVVARSAFALPFKNNKIMLFNKEKYAVNPLLVALLILAIGIALFAIFTPMINRISDTDSPIASFEKEKIDDHWKFLNLSKTFGSDNRITEVEWTVYSDDVLFNTYDTHNLNLSFNTEGIYKISLHVMDKFGNWSDPYTEEIYYTMIDLDPISDNLDDQTQPGDEALNSYTITFEGSPVFDSEEVRSGDKSIRMDFVGDQTHGIIMDNVFMDNNTKVSFWIKATDDPSLTISAIGLNHGDSVFSLSKVIHPKIDQWQKIEFNTNTSVANTLKVFINGEDLTLWLDDIEVNSYK